MRTVRALGRLPCRERSLLLAVPSHSTIGRACRGHLDAYSWPACLAVRRQRANCVAVRSCAIAAPQRQHTIFTSELGYRTDFTEQYSLLEIIGKGNFGTVWLAASRHDPSQQVAVKVIAKLRSDRTHDDSLECIKREVAMWACLSGDSRFVVQLLGLYEDRSSVYLVQQLCPGGDLGSVLKDTPLLEPCCAAMMWCVLSAIRDCHAHRLALIDVKPQNFLLTGSRAVAGVPRPVTELRLSDQVAGGGAAGPCVVACDFGCSVSYSDLMRGAKRAGSPVFFAPEQFTSSYGLGVDVWAAGVMLYLLLTGRYPFWDCKREELEAKLPAYQVMLAVCSAPISFSGPEWRGLSREARELVSTMLDRNPSTRITAQQALQHPWFARVLQQEAAKGVAAGAAAAAAAAAEGLAAAAEGGPSGTAAAAAAGRKAKAADRRALRHQQQHEQLRQRQLRQQQHQAAAAGRGDVESAEPSASRPTPQACCGRMVSAAVAAGPTADSAAAGPGCCGGAGAQSNIVPLPSLPFAPGMPAAALRGAGSNQLFARFGDSSGGNLSEASGDEAAPVAAAHTLVAGGVLSGASGDEDCCSSCDGGSFGTDDDDEGSVWGGPVVC